MIENLPLVLTGIGLTASVLYYTMVLRNANKTRQAQLFMQMYNRWLDDIDELQADMREGSPTYWTIIQTRISGFKEFQEKGENDIDFRRTVGFFNGFLEGLGVIVKAGYIDMYPIALMWTGVTRTYYENILESILEEIRNYYDAPRALSEAEYLCKELLKYIEEHPELAT